jgi:uncharacterized membrane protein
MELEQWFARIDARLAAIERRLETGSTPAPATAAPVTPVAPTSPAAPAIHWAPASTSAAPRPMAPEPQRLALPPPPLPWASEPPPVPETSAGSGSSSASRLERSRAHATAGSPAGAASKSSGWESYLGITVLGRLGIAAVLLAAAWLAQLAHDGMPPVMRVLATYSLAAALIGVGAFLRGRAAKPYVAILWGGGIAAAYLAAAMARLRYELIDPTTAMALLVAACAMGQTLARIAGQAELAHVALIGAFAAPLIVDSPQDARTSLLLYVVLLHGWAATTERRWGWRGARAFALAGALVVIVAWLVRHGGMDHSTQVHLQAYLLGLSAPEWVLALRGATLAHHRASWAFGGVLLAALASFAPLSLRGTRADQQVLWQVALGTAGIWSALTLAVRARRGAADEVVRALALTSSLLLVIAANLAGTFAVIGWDREGCAVICTATAGLFCLGASSYLGERRSAVFLAALLACLSLEPRAAFDPWLLLALLLPAVLMARAAHTGIRAGAFFLGALSIASSFSFCREEALVALGLAMASMWCAAYAAGARARQSNVELALTLPVLGILSLAWLAALAAPFASVATPIGNGGTLAALAIALSAGWTWRCAFGSAPDGGLRAIPAVIALLVLGIAGFREVDALAVRHAPAFAGLVHTLYLLAACAGYRRLASKPGTGTTPFVLSYVALGAALFFVVDRLQERGVPGDWTLAGEMVALAAGIALSSPREARLSSPHAWSTWALACAYLILAIVLVAEQRFLASTAVFNPRCATGLAVVALIAYLAARADELPVKRLFRILACFVGYGVGLPEVLEQTRGLASFEARAAAMSIYSSAAAGAVLAFGFALRAVEMRWLALLGFGAIMAKIGLYDVAQLAAPYRIGITGALGCVLLLSAWGYARREVRLAHD